ncbi:MAG: hypothetical protein CL566_10900 [Alphaproteobacteria bacterium]|nr:hypothetical protein [Alphaproteobacteria bacterium]
MEWMIKCVSKPGMAERREQTIAAHIEHLDKFKAETWYSGPMMVGDGSNANGSFRVINFPARADARAYIDTDPYTTADIFHSIDIERLLPFTDVRQRDYDQTEGNAQFVAIARTDPRPVAAGPEVGAFLSDAAEHIVVAGALSDDAGETASGALYVLDVPDRPTVTALLRDEPFSAGADGRSLTIERWRFGHV